MMHQHLIWNILLWLHISSSNIWEPSYKSILNISVQNTINSHTYTSTIFILLVIIVIIPTSVTFLIIYTINNFSFLFTCLRKLYIWNEKNYWNLINYSQQQNPIWPPGGHFVKAASLEINRLLIHTHKYRKFHCGGKTILRSSYLSIMGFPILVRYIFIYIESGPWSDFLIETATVTRDRDSWQCSTTSL